MRARRSGLRYSGGSSREARLSGGSLRGIGWRAIQVGVLAPGLFLFGCDRREATYAGSEAPLSQGARGVEASASGTEPAGELPVAVTPQDVTLLREKLGWGREVGLDTMALGDAMARLGRTFVGTTYTPGTLEVDGPERIVINLRELDCVTFVESVYALSALIRDRHLPTDATSDALIARYAREIEGLRYRGGRLDGYASRLHYFSEWIADNQSRGRVRDLTADLGGVPYPAPVDFMSRHPEAYRQLADSMVVREIQEVEARLARQDRWRIPQEALADAARGIQDGDIIAATSVVAGLDVAHTGIALWEDGMLHLLHAPLVGREVEISQLPLAERIQGIHGQDGIMVARPVEPAGMEG